MNISYRDLYPEHKSLIRTNVKVFCQGAFRIGESPARVPPQKHPTGMFFHPLLTASKAGWGQAHQFFGKFANILDAFFFCFLIHIQRTCFGDDTRAGSLTD